VADTPFAAAIRELSPSSWWKLAGDGVDEMAVASGTLQGTPTATASLVPGDGGLAGQALDFPGTDDFVDCGDFYDFTGTASFSISFFLKYRTLATVDDIVVIMKEPAWRIMFPLGIPDDIQFIRNETAASTFPTNFSAGSNAFIVFTYDGAGTIGYMNGTNLGTWNTTQSITNTANPLVFGGKVGWTDLDGVLQHVAIWDGTVLTQANVTSLYNASLPGGHIAWVRA
jgi:hypothetical protein